MNVYVQKIEATAKFGAQFTIMLSSPGGNGATEMWVVVKAAGKPTTRGDLPLSYKTTGEAFQAAVRFIKNYPGLKYGTFEWYENPWGDLLISSKDQRDHLKVFGLDTPINVARTPA